MKLKKSVKTFSKIYLVEVITNFALALFLLIIFKINTIDATSAIGILLFSILLPIILLKLNVIDLS